MLRACLSAEWAGTRRRTESNLTVEQGLGELRIIETNVDSNRAIIPLLCNKQRMPRTAARHQHSGFGHIQRSMSIACACYTRASLDARAAEHE